MIATYQDAIEHVIDYVGGTATENAQRDARRAVLEGYRDIGNAHNWSYLYKHGRIVTSPPYNAGTIQYTHTGGTYERMVTLTGGIWPDYAAGSYVKIGLAAYRVSERKSATVVVFDDVLNPGSDLDAGTAYKLYRDTYLLPIDFIASDQSLYEQNFGGMAFVHPREWLFENRYIYAEGVPQWYTVTGDTLYPGRLVMRIVPWPSEAKTIDFVYKRRPRALSTDGLTTTCSAASGSQTVTSSANAFSPSMVGSVVRLSRSATSDPTSEVGENPAAFESVIFAYVGPSQVTVSDPIPSDFTGVRAVVSDPIDIEPGAMLNAFWRCIEMHISMNRTLKDKPSARLQYASALSEAKAADSRSFMGRRAGQRGYYRQRLRDMPMGPDQP